MQLPWQKKPLALNSPRDLPGLALWLDSKDVSSLRNNAGAQPVTTDGIKLASDKSGNSSVNVLCLNGVAGNYVSAPNIAAYNITDLDVRVNLALISWTAGAVSSNPLARYQASGQRVFWLTVLTDGRITLFVSLDGTAVLTGTSTALVPFAAFQAGWIRATRVAATGVFTFYTSTDGITWSQLGTTVTLATGAPFNGTSVVEVGSANTGASPTYGNIYRAQIYNGINGTLVFDANFSLAAKLATSFTESSSNAATVTINTSGATGARISGARDLVQMTAANQPILTIAAAGNYLTFDGSNDYLKAAAFSMSQPATIYGVLSAVSWTSGDAILDGDAALSAALVQISASPTFNLTVTASACLNSGLAVGTTSVVTAIPNAASSLTRVNRLAASSGDTGAAKVLNGFTLGSRGSGSSNANITAQEVLVYSGAHDKATQDRVIAYLANRNRIALT